MTRKLLPLVTLVFCIALVAGCSASPAAGGQTRAAPTTAEVQTQAAPAAGPSPVATKGSAASPSTTATAQSTTPTATQSGEVLPALSLAVEVPWTPVYAGDPLRLVVRLASPRAMDELYAQYLAAEAGKPTPAPAFAVPAIPADWAQGVTLTLYRLEAGGARKDVLTGAAWAPHLRQKEADLPEIGLVVWSREWLVPAETAQLKDGEYVLTASWNGQGLDRALLGPTGAVKAEEVRFTVKAPADDSEKAVRASRLAYCAYAKGDYALARKQGQQALDTGIDDGTPERWDTYFLVAGAAFGLEDYNGAIAAYQRVIQLAPEGSELALLAQQWVDMIEEMQAGPGSSAQAGPTPTARPARASTPAAAGSGFAGAWDASGWGTMTLAVDGNRVSGTFKVNDGKIEGTLSADGRTLEGTWSMWPTYAPPNDAGRLVLMLSDDGNTLQGHWWYGEDQDAVEWLCTRAGR